MNKKTGLGRGLSALLGDEIEIREEPASGEKVMQVSIDKIDPNPNQPRRAFDEEALEQLADSIRSVGILQPILAEEKDGRYTLIAGERRWRAARMAGLAEVPVIVRQMEDAARAEAALIENLQRDDLNCVDEALAISDLMEKFGYTQETCAARLGKSRPAVANALRLLTLPEEVISMLREGKLSQGHAKALAGLNDRVAILRLANLAAAQAWSVRQTEKICAANAGKKPEKKPVPRRSPELGQLEQMARRAFGTKAELEGDEKRGKLVLRYYNSEDLQRIWDLLSSILPEE